MSIVCHRRHSRASTRANPFDRDPETNPQSQTFAGGARLVEAITWSFVSKREAELFGGGKTELALANPIATELSDMRPSLIPGLVMAAQRNADRGFPDSALFEVGQIFKGDGPDDQLTAAAAGAVRWASHREADDIGRARLGRSMFSTPRPTLLPLLAAAGSPMQALQVVPGGPPWFHPGRSGSIQIGPQNILGYFGELRPSIDPRTQNPKDRSSLSRSFWKTFQNPKCDPRGQSRHLSYRRFNRWKEISRSWSTAQ